MTGPLWATVLVSALGICVALAIWAYSLRPRPDRARDELGRGLERVDVALISGGVARATDSDLVDLIERGLLRADRGRLIATGLPLVEHRGNNVLSLTVEELGEPTLDSVRERAGILGYYTAILRLTRRRLIISPDRVSVAPAMLWAPTMVLLFLCTLSFLGGNTQPPGLPPWAPVTISVGVWIVVPLVQLAIWCRQPGYHGRDPRSRLGLDVVDELAARIGPTSSQANRVAIGGFAAMTDHVLRQAIMGTTSDSAWDARPWRKRVFKANAANRSVWP